MKLLIGILLTCLSTFYYPSTDCSLDNFVGTWKGAVEFNGSELPQGPYEFSLHEDGKSLSLKDETGAIFTLTVEGCEAVNHVQEEGMDMETTYTFSEGDLKVISIIKISDGDGNLQEMKMTGSMSKTE